MAESIRIKFSGEDAVTPVLKDINSGIGSLSSKIEESGQVFNKVNKVLLAGFTALATSVTAIGVKAIKSFSEFDQHIKRAQVLAGGSTADFQRLTDAALELGTSTAFSALEVSGAFEEFAKSGFKVNQILSATESTLHLATISGSSLSDAISSTVSVLNTFQRNAQDTVNVANTLSVTFTNSAQSLNDLSEAIRIVGPLASSLGISFEELSAALGAMAQSGVKGSNAGSSLNMALMQLLKPTDKATTLMEGLGIQFFNLNDSAKAANAVIQISKDEFGSLQDNVKQSDIEVAKLGSRLAEAKRQLKEFSGAGTESVSLKNNIEDLQTAFDSARLRNKELKDSLDAQDKTLSDLREQVKAGQADFIGLRNSAKMLNDAFDKMNASKVQRATALVELFQVRGAKSFLALTKQVDDFQNIFDKIAGTEIRTEILDESGLKKALSAQDSFAKQFGITFDNLVKGVAKVPQDIDKSLQDIKLDERARAIFGNLRNEINKLGLDSQSIEAILSDFLPTDSVKDFRQIIQLSDSDFEKFLKNINSTNMDAQTLSKTLLQNLGSAFSDLGDSVSNVFVRLGGALSEKLRLADIVRSIQGAIDSFASGGGIDKIAQSIVNVIKLLQSFFTGVSTGFKQVFTPDILENLKNAFGNSFQDMQNKASSFGTILGRILGSVAKGGAELITKVLNSNLIENASNMFMRLGNVLEKMGPTIGAVATAFIILSPILGPLLFVAGKIVNVFGFLITAIMNSGKVINFLVGGTSQLTTGLAGLVGKITGVSTTAASATAGTTGFLAKLGTIGSSIGTIFSAIGSALGVSAGAAAAIVVVVIGTIIGFVNQVRQNFLGLGDDFKTIFGFIWTILSAIGSAIKESLVDIGGLITPIWEGIKETFNGLGKILGSLVAIVIKPFANSIRSAGEQGINAFDIIKTAVSLLFTPLKLVLTIIGSVMQAIGAIINFVAEVISGIVQFGFAVADAFSRFRTEGFSAFNQVGELAKNIGLSILKSFIGGIDSIINIFIDLINEVVKVAKKIPFLNKLIGENFKIDKDVLGSLTGFAKEAEKINIPQPEIQKKTVAVTTAVKKSTASFDNIRTDNSFDSTKFSMPDLSSSFSSGAKVSSVQTDLSSAFPSAAQGTQMGKDFGNAFFTGLAEGMKNAAKVFDSSIKPIFTSMNTSLNQFISTFLRDLYVLKIVPVFLQSLATRMYSVFVTAWHTMFLAVIDVTEKSINTLLSNLGKFFNQLVTVVNKLVAEYNRAADILSRDITRTTYSTSTDSKGKTKTVAHTETLYKGVNVPKLQQFSSVQLAPVKLERPTLPQAPAVNVDTGGFSVNIQNFNASSETDKQKLFSEIDAYIARTLGNLVRL